MDKMELAKAEISKMKVQIVIWLVFALTFFVWPFQVKFNLGKNVGKSRV